MICTKKWADFEKKVDFMAIWTNTHVNKYQGSHQFLKSGKAIEILHTTVKYVFNRMVERDYAFVQKIVSEYDQEIPQSQTEDNPVAPRGRAAQPSRDTRETN